MKSITKTIILIAIAIPFLSFSQSGNKSHLMNSWYESPHESDIDHKIIAFRLNKYIPVPGIDVNPDFKYCHLVFKENNEIIFKDWRWCENTDQQIGTWMKNENMIDLTINKCKYTFNILTLTKDYLVVQFSDL